MRIRGIKGKRRKEKGTFWPLRNPGGKEERKKTREKGERRGILAKKPTSFEEKERRSCIPRELTHLNHL